MRQKKNLQRAGFSLMELMVVVVIIGVLSAVALPSINRFIIKSKESEATINLAAISRGAQLYFKNEQIDKKTGIVFPSQFPTTKNSNKKQGVFAMSPKTDPCKEIAGSPKYRRNSARWMDAKEPWVDLKFAIATSHYFQYGFANNNSTGSSARYTVQARADLDCDAKLSTFRVIGQVNSSTGEPFRGGVIVLQAGE